MWYYCQEIFLAFGLFAGKLRDIREFWGGRWGGARAVLAPGQPECINSAQYITIPLYKEQEGENFPFREEIFGLFWYFFAEKNWDSRKVTLKHGHRSKKCVERLTASGEKQERCQKWTKYVIIFIQYAINSIFSRALRTRVNISNKGTQERLPSS